MSQLGSRSYSRNTKREVEHFMKIPLMESWSERFHSPAESQHTLYPKVVNSFRCKVRWLIVLSWTFSIVIKPSWFFITAQHSHHTVDRELERNSYSNLRKSQTFYLLLSVVSKSVIYILTVNRKLFSMFLLDIRDTASVLNKNSVFAN